MLRWVVIVSLAVSGQGGPLNKNMQETLQNAAIVFPNTSTHVLPLRIATEQVTYPQAIKSIHYGAARLLKLTLEERRDNWLVSPVSLAAMLGQLMLGAKGNFRRTLGDILTPGLNNSDGPPGLDVQKELGSLLTALQDEKWTDYTLYIASALFIQPDIDLKCSYKHALQDIYNLNIIKTDFTNAPSESMESINAWVNQTTFGKIKTVLTEPASSSTAALYINSVYFKGAWKAPFDPSLTKSGTFSVNATYKVPVEYMASDMEVKYIKDEKSQLKMIGIPYEGSSIYLYIFLPEGDSAGRLTDVADDLTPDRMSELIANAQLNNVTVILPKVKLTTTISLRRPMLHAVHALRRSLLKNPRGARDTSEEELELLSNSVLPGVLPLRIDQPGKDQKVTFNMGSASDDYRFRINDLLHKVELEMSESGIEAVAVTSTLVDYFGTQLFRVDRPFLFMIRHEMTGVHLFWGAIYDPSSLSG